MTAANHGCLASSISPRSNSYAPQREERELETVPPASPSSESSVRNVARCRRQMSFRSGPQTELNPIREQKIETTSPRCCVATDGVNVVPFVRHSSRHRVRKTAVKQGAHDIAAAMAVHRRDPIGSSFPRRPGKNVSSRRGRRIGGAMIISARRGRHGWASHAESTTVRRARSLLTLKGHIAAIFNVEI